MNTVPLIIRVHATKITKEISDSFTISDSMIKHVTKLISDSYAMSDYVVADGDMIELKYPV